MTGQIAAFPINITNHLSTLFIKSSILCFYLRFSTSRLFNIVIYVVLFIVVVANFIGALGILFFCRPISFFWDFAPMDGTCIPADPWYAWLIILNCVTDGILLVLPAWIIYPLRVGFAQKAAIAAILGTGGLYVFSAAAAWNRTDANGTTQYPRGEHLPRRHCRPGLGHYGCHVPIFGQLYLEVWPPLVLTFRRF